LAIISADEADVSKSYIATNSNAPALVFQGPADSLGVGSEYQKFNSSNDAFTLGTYHNDDLLYYGAGGTDSAPNAAFRFDSCTGAVDVSHSYAGDANASGSVAAIEIVGSAAVLIQDGFRAENNVRSGTENFFVHASGAGGIFGGSFHGLIVNSIASNYVVWHLLNGALIGGLQGDAHSNAPGVTWTGGDGTGRFMANTIILAPTGKWGTFDGVRSWGNQISTNDGIAPYPQYSPTSGLSSAIVAQPASLDLYGQRIEFWISNVPSCWMSAAAGASLGCMNTRGDFTAHEDLVAGRSVNTPAINNGAIPVGTAVVGTNGNSQFVAQAGTIGNSTTGTAAGLAAQYIDWNAGSGGTSIKNKPTLWAPYVQPSDPGCTTIGSVWFNTAASTTAMNVCMSVAGALQWVAK
jgi:hypothetical protein